LICYEKYGIINCITKSETTYVLNGYDIMLTVRKVLSIVLCVLMFAVSFISTCPVSAMTISDLPDSLLEEFSRLEKEDDICLAKELFPLRIRFKNFPETDFAKYREIFFTE